MLIKYLTVNNLIRFLQLKGYNMEVFGVPEQIPNEYQQAILFFELIEKLFRLENNFSSNSTQAREEQKIVLDDFFDLLTKWTKSLSEKWHNEIGKEIATD